MRIRKKREVDYGELMVRAKPLAAGAVVLAVAAGLFFAWRGMDRVMFTNNPGFTVTEVIVNTGLAVKEDEVKLVTGITEGVNIFSFDAVKTSRAFLQSYPAVANLRIKKTLPSTVEITAEDREPALRVGQSAIIISRDGLVMVADEAMQRRWGSVPVLTSGTTPIKTEPGGRVKDGSKIALALEIANMHNAEQGMLFKIGNIDIGNEVYAVMETAGSRVPRIIRFPWDEIGPGGNVIRRALVAVSKTLANPDAANEARFTVLLSTDPPRVIGNPTWD